jgi:hypothetical protein
MGRGEEMEILARDHTQRSGIAYDDDGEMARDAKLRDEMA